MKILALDSSGLVASVAVVEENDGNQNLLAEYTVNYKKTHSQTLLPMLDEIVKMIELDLKSIDAIALAAGPGSFTGLRIGSAMAKGLGFALEKPLIEIPTVDALAYNLYGTDRVICPLMDARRNQVYTGIYEFCGGSLHVLEPQMAAGIETAGFGTGSDLPGRRSPGIPETSGRGTDGWGNVFFCARPFEQTAGGRRGRSGAAVLKRRKDCVCGGTQAGLSAAFPG